MTSVQLGGTVGFFCYFGFYRYFLGSRGVMSFQHRWELLQLQLQLRLLLRLLRLLGPPLPPVLLPSPLLLQCISIHWNSSIKMIISSQVTGKVIISRQVTWKVIISRQVTGKMIISRQVTGKMIISIHRLHTHPYTHARAHTRGHKHTHTHTHTHTHAHAHARARPNWRPLRVKAWNPKSIGKTQNNQKNQPLRQVEPHELINAWSQ